MKNYKTILTLGCVCLLSMVAGCDIQIGDWGQAKYDRTVQRQAPLPASSTLVAKTSLGFVTITGADVTDCNVVAEISGRAPTEAEAQELAEQVEITLETVGNTMTVKADKPTTKHNRSISISYTITVPKQTRIECASSYGAVKVSETKDISVDMKAPNQDGNFSGMWRLKGGGKTFAGDPLTVVIISGSPAAAAPPPAPAQPPAAAPPAVAPPSSGPTMFGVQAHWGGLWNQEDKMAETTSRVVDLGMGWTKLQVRWGSEDYFYDCSGSFGFDWNHTNQVINAAGAKGVRVLFSVVTSPPCTHPGSADVELAPDDPNVFAAFVGELASRYAGRGIAIEIWERPNATPGLGAGRYTQMLAASYNKIKAADSGIIVIGGAPAPYVAGGDVPAMTYLQQIKAAGADKYMDCVGVYFNDSTAPPDGTFKGLVQGYQSAMGKQACITSFGVGSEQNVGHVPGIDYFKDNTEANQAEWSTQSMELARQLGARMIILFNLDYGPLSGLNPNALFSFFTPSYFRRPVYSAVKNWCAANGCK